MDVVRVSIVILFIIAISGLVVGILALTKSREKFEVVGETSDAELTTSAFTDLIEDNKTLIAKLVRDDLAKTTDMVYIPYLKTDDLSTNRISGATEADPLTIYSDGGLGNGVAYGHLQVGWMNAGADIVGQSLNANVITVNPYSKKPPGLVIKGNGAGGVSLTTGASGGVTTTSLNVTNKEEITIGGGNCQLTCG